MNTNIDLDTSNDINMYNIRLKLFKYRLNNNEFNEYKLSDLDIEFLIKNNYDDYLIYNKCFINKILDKFMSIKKCRTNSLNLKNELKSIIDTEIDYIHNLDVLHDVKKYIDINILNKLLLEILVQQENDELFKKSNYPLNKSLIEKYDNLKEEDRTKEDCKRDRDNYLINLYKYYKDSDLIKNYNCYFFFKYINQYNRIKQNIYYNTSNRLYLHLVLYYNKYFIGIYNNNFIICNDEDYNYEIEMCNIDNLDNMTTSLLGEKQNIFDLDGKELYEVLESSDNFTNIEKDIYNINSNYIKYNNEINYDIDVNRYIDKYLLNIDLCNKKVNHILFKSKIYNKILQHTDIINNIDKYTKKVHNTRADNIMRDQYIVDLFNYLCDNSYIFCVSNYLAFCTLEKVIFFVLREPYHKNILNLLLSNIRKYSCISNPELPYMIDHTIVHKYMKYHLINYDKMNNVEKLVYSRTHNIYKVNKLIETHHKYNYYPLFYTDEKRILNNDLNENYIPINYGLIQLVCMYYDVFVFTDKCGRNIYTYFFNIEDRFVYYLDLNIVNNFDDTNHFMDLDIKIKKSFQLSNIFNNIIKEFCSFNKIILNNYKYDTNDIMDYIGYKFNNFNKVIESENKIQCLICFDDYNNVFRTKCNHNYCIECSEKWFIEKDESFCPYCRRNINNVDVEYSIYDYQLLKDNVSTMDIITNGLNFII